MAVYGVFTYDITDPEGYGAYSPGSLAVIAATMAIRIATTDNLTMFIADAIEPGD